MYRDLLPYLSCPRCTADGLALDVAHEQDEDVVDGTVRCAGCGTTLPIVDGIVDALVAPVPRVPAQLVNTTTVGAWGYERLWRWYALTLFSGRRFPLREERRLVRGLMAPERGGLIVDAACSTALYGRSLTAPDATVVAVDHAWSMLREARRTVQREGARLSFVRARVQTLPFRTGSAAGYGMGGSLNEIGDIDAMIGEARRVVAEDGRLVTMNLVRARSAPGRLLQSLLATGGLQFPPQNALNRRWHAHGWRLMAQWRWRVVTISLLRPLVASVEDRPVEGINVAL